MLAHSHGLTLADTPEKADVLLLNTCSIREKAQEKVFSDLGRWYKIKQLQQQNLKELSSERRILQLMRLTLINILNAKGVIYTYYKQQERELNEQRKQINRT